MIHKKCDIVTFYQLINLLFYIKDIANKKDILMLPECHVLLVGRGDKNRTRISGFGDRCTAIVLHP